MNKNRMFEDTKTMVQASVVDLPMEDTVNVIATLMEDLSNLSAAFAFADEVIKEGTGEDLGLDRDFSPQLIGLVEVARKVAREALNGELDPHGHVPDAEQEF
jgi:putative heme iron utilization protein